MGSGISCVVIKRFLFPFISNQKIKLLLHYSGGVGEGCGYQRSSSSTPHYYDRNNLSLLRAIFRYEGAKNAFINFLRHEEGSHTGETNEGLSSSYEENYYKKGNFAIIGLSEDILCDILLHHNDCDGNSRRSSEEFHHDHLLDHSHHHNKNHQQCTHYHHHYTSLEPFFNDIDPDLRTELLSPQHRSCHDLLEKFLNSTDEIILMMAIEALPRFKASKSFKTWWDSENGSEFSQSELFSSHDQSPRTSTLRGSTGKRIEAIWSKKGDLFIALLHCLDSIPVATAIIFEDVHHQYPMIYVSDLYAQCFGGCTSEMLNRPFNLLGSDERIPQFLTEKKIQKFSLKYQEKFSPQTSQNSFQYLAVGMKPILDENTGNLYRLIIIVDMKSSTFCMETLKLSMDLLDIFPSTFLFSLGENPVSPSCTSPPSDPLLVDSVHIQ